MNEVSNNSEELCKMCGLCCQGVFHSYAYIYNEKDKQAIKDIQAKITYLEDDKLEAFSLPCPAFSEICTVYSKRPSVCCEHECDILKNYKNQKMTLDKAMETIHIMQDVLKPLLPALKHVSNDFFSNNPEFLRKKLLESFPDKTMSEEFKYKNKKMLMNYSLFLFLKETYFYIPLGNKIEKNIKKI